MITAFLRHFKMTNDCVFYQVMYNFKISFDICIFFHRYLSVSQKESLLEEPIDILKGTVFKNAVAFLNNKKPSTTPTCNGLITAQKMGVNSVPGAIFLPNNTQNGLLLGRSLVEGKILKPWKGAPSSHSVCLFVCKQATDHNFWYRNLIFGLSDPCNMRKNFFFRNFHFYAFYRHFSIFSLYNTSKFLVSSFWSQFFT